MIRVPTLALAIALCAAPLAPAAAQGAEEDPLVQRLLDLEQSGQGVLLPLDGALDPPAPAETAPPELPTPPSEASLTGLAGAGDETVPGSAGEPPDEESPVAAPAAATTEVEVAVEVDETAVVTEGGETTEAAAGQEVAPAMEVTEEAGSLPALDAITDIATAELGNPESIGPWRLWLASYRTIREAQTGWQQLAKENRDLLGDLSPVIVMKELGGGGDTFFRLQAGPLADAATAGARCEALKARNLYCAILGPQDG